MTESENILRILWKGNIIHPNGVNRPEIVSAKLITENYGLKKDDYILFLGRLVPEKGSSI